MLLTLNRRDKQISDLVEVGLKKLETKVLYTCALQTCMTSIKVEDISVHPSVPSFHYLKNTCQYLILVKVLFSSFLRGPSHET